MNEVKLLIFDLDDTLINYGGVTYLAWQDTCQKAVHEFYLTIDPVLLANEIVKVNDSIWQDESKRPRGNFSFYQLRKSIVQEALAHLKIKNEKMVEFLVKNYDQCKHNAMYVFEDVFVTLKTLKQRGYIIALLTNGDARIQREKLDRFKMEPLFDVIFIDGEQGVGKPEKEAYMNVLRQFDCEPHEACMIGDHYLWEVVAPITYGLKAIWVHRSEVGVKGHEDIQANAVIENIHKLLDIFTGEKLYEKA